MYSVYANMCHRIHFKTDYAINYCVNIQIFKINPKTYSNIKLDKLEIIFLMFLLKMNVFRCEMCHNR